MKKTKTVLAMALAMAGSAHAQSSVTLYGVADAGVNYVSGQDAAKTRISSGIMEGSRWGLKGNEDLGGGYRTVFTMEARVELDNGSNSNRAASGSQVPDRLTFTTAELGLPPIPLLQGAINNVSTALGDQIGVNLDQRPFDRQLYVGLVTPVGAVLAGRMYTPGYEMFYVFEAMQTDSSLSAAQIATLPPAFDIRKDNSLAYRIEKDGWTGTLTMAFGEQPGSVSDGRYLGGNLYYKGSGWGAGVAYSTNNNTNGDQALRNAVAGAYVDVGPGRLNAIVLTAKDDNPQAMVSIRTALANPLLGAAGGIIGDAFEEQLKQDSRLYQVGYRIKTGPHMVTAAYNYFDDRLHDDTNTSSYGAVYTYAFSKRTDVNFVATRYVNDSNAQAAPGGGGFFGGATSEAGRDAYNLALALRHRF